LEILGQISPGVSHVNVTAPTSQILSGTRGVLKMVRDGRTLWAMLAHRHI